MKKNFHWLVFALIAIAFWRTSENLLFERKMVMGVVEAKDAKFGWQIYETTSMQGVPVMYLKRCLIHRLFDWTRD